MAEPPHIEEPTPIRHDTFLSAFSIFIRIIAVNSDVRIVDMITGRLLVPTFAIVPRFSENPRIITAHCKIFFEVNLIPFFSRSFDDNEGNKSVISIPVSIEKTGAPITSNENEPVESLERNVDIAAIIMHNPTPQNLFLINVIFNHL
jgi:hypothetical protein